MDIIYVSCDARKLCIYKLFNYLKKKSDITTDTYTCRIIITKFLSYVFII